MFSDYFGAFSSNFALAFHSVVNRTATGTRTVWALVFGVVNPKFSF